MSTQRDRQKQKKAERKKKQRNARVDARRSRLDGQRTALSQPHTWELADAYQAQDPADDGTFLFIASRKHTDGRLAGVAATFHPFEGLQTLELYDGRKPNALAERLTSTSEHIPMLICTAADVVQSLTDGHAQRLHRGHDALPRLKDALAYFPEVQADEAELPMHFTDRAEPEPVQKTGGLLSKIVGFFGIR